MACRLRSQILLSLLAIALPHLSAHSQRTIQATRTQADKVLVVAHDGSGDFFRIQDAIDRAEFNAKIRIKAGTYRENLILKGFVNLEGAGADKTVIVGAMNAPVVLAYNLGSARISHLTFQFDHRTDQPVLLVRYASFSLFKCGFRNGSTGIDIAYHSSVNIRECTVSENREGIRIHGKCQGLISGSIVAHNTENGLVVDDRSSPAIERSTFRANGDHAVILRGHSMSRVAGNYLFANRNGISIQGGSSPIVRNNTIVNHAEGYGIRLEDCDGTALINNNIVKNHTGFQGTPGRHQTVVYNNLWSNRIDYANFPKSPTDLSVDPRFINETAFDFRIDSSSALFEAGEDRLSIGADFDYSRSESKLRIDYLKNQASKELGRENWYLAYQAAQEILSLDKGNVEGQNFRTKAALKLAQVNIDRARAEFESDNLRLAENYLRNALSFDPENKEAFELKDQIDSSVRTQQLRFMTILAVIISVLFATGYYVRKRIQFSERKRQAKWWLDDAEEHVELARAAEGEAHASDDFHDALRHLAMSKAAFVERRYDEAEHLCNETVRLAHRAKDVADRFRQVRKDALVEVSNAETLMQQIQDSELTSLYPEDVREFSFYLERAQHALINKQFVLAKEVAEDIQATIRKLQTDLENKRQKEIHELIRETGELIIDALSSSSSTDIIIAVIDFKSELEVLKSGFESGQLSVEEARTQVSQIRDFVTEALRLAAADGGTRVSGRKRNYYEILGLKEDATLDQIKAVYRKLSMIYHPDMNVADESGIAGDERFREIKEAYEALVVSKSSDHADASERR